MPWPLSWDDSPNTLAWLCKALHPGEEHTSVPRMVLMCPSGSLQKWSTDLPRCLEVPCQRNLSCEPNGGPSSAGKGLVTPPGLHSSSGGWRHLWTVILALDFLNKLSQSVAFCFCTAPSSQSYPLPFTPSSVDLKILLNRRSAGQSPPLRVLGNPSPITQFLDLQGFGNGDLCLSGVEYSESPGFSLATLLPSVSWSKTKFCCFTYLEEGKFIDFRFSLSCIGEGNGNPLQCSCLENPRDGGAWWAAVWQSRTWLKQLSSSSSKFIKVSCISWRMLSPWMKKHKLLCFLCLRDLDAAL